MKIVTARLELSTNFDNRTRERCPSIVFEHEKSILTTLRTDVERPELPIPTDSLSELIILDDALSRVIDEEVWLNELHRVLRPGGILRFSLPAEGALAWLDTMNAYRYIADISKRGDQPNAALPTGWNRHYRKSEVESLVRGAEFAELEIRSGNCVISEVRLLGGMIWHNWVLRDREAELKLFPKFGRRDPPNELRILTTTWWVTAQKGDRNRPAAS